jgi:hypothetical protein
MDKINRKRRIFNDNELNIVSLQHVKPKTFLNLEKSGFIFTIKSSFSYVISIIKP